MKAPMTKQRRVIKLKRKPLNEMKVSFPSYSENERFARVAVSGFLTQLDPQIDELSRPQCQRESQTPLSTDTETP